MTFRDTFKNLQQNHLLQVLGEDAIYTPEGYAHPSNMSETIKGRFVENPFDSNGVNSNTSVFVCFTENVPGVKDGAKLRFDSVDYIIRKPQILDNGQVEMMLEKI